MTYHEYKNALEKDRARYARKSHLLSYILYPGYKIIVNYRRCRLFQENKLAYPLYMLQRVRYNRLCVKYGCDIPSHTTIGAGFRIDHPVGVVINSQARIGDNVTVKSGVVIGDTFKGTPIIGDNVLFGVHAIVIGPVKVGKNVIIGAGSVVTKNIESDSVYCGVPAKKIKSVLIG